TSSRRLLGGGGAASVAVRCLSFLPTFSVGLPNSARVGHRVDHPAELGAIFFADRRANALESEGAKCVSLGRVRPDDRAYLRYFEVTHDAVASASALTPSAWARRSGAGDRKSTCLNSSHVSISYAVFCLKKKKTNKSNIIITILVYML